MSAGIGAPESFVLCVLTIFCDGLYQVQTEAFLMRGESYHLPVSVKICIQKVARNFERGSSVKAVLVNSLSEFVKVCTHYQEDSESVIKCDSRRHALHI